MISKQKVKLIGVITCSLVFILVGTVKGHHLEVTEVVRENTVEITAGFRANDPLTEGQVEIYNGDGLLLQEGTTDSDGQYEFKLTPVAADLRIVVSDHLGHRAETVIAQEKIARATNADANQEQSDNFALDQEQLETIISQEVEKNLVELEEQIKSLNQDSGPGTTEVIGGLGYIFGLFGLGFYFKAGKDEND